MKRRLLLLAAILAAAGLTAGAAIAFDSGKKPGGTGPNTIVWTGNGASNGVLDSTECPSGTSVPAGINPNSYLHWILTTGGGSAHDDPAPVLHLGGSGSGAYPATKDSGGAFHFFTPYVTPDGALTAYADIDVLKTGGGPWILTISHGCPGDTTPPAADPTVSKTVSGSYDTTYGWEITKKADTTRVYSAGGGESGTVTYTVSASHDGGTVGNVTVSGAITVGNPNAGAITLGSVTDQLSDGTVCDVDTKNAGLVVPASGNLVYPYTCTLEKLPAGELTNTATAAWSLQTLSDGSSLAAGSAEYTSGTVEFTGTDIDTCVDLSDTLGGELGTVCVGDSTTEFSYPKTFTDPPGTCTSHLNTASFVTNNTGATGDSDTVTVEDCQGADLEVAKTAAPSFERTYGWTIGKTVDKTYVEQAGGSATFNYTVSVLHDGGADSGWAVTGTITVTNPNDWQDITADITDAIDNGGTCSVTGGDDATIPAGKSVEFAYTCTYASAPDPAAFKNTATATWDAAAAHTPHGSSSVDAAGAFGSPTTVTDECVSVTDSLEDTLTSSWCVGGDNPKTFTYARTISAPSLGTCQAYDNTASFTTNDTSMTGNALQSVTLCNFNVPLTIGYWKTHIRQCKPGEKTGTGGCNSKGPFAGQYLPRSLGPYLVDTDKKALDVFNANNCSNASTSSQNAAACLAAQLLAAKLNRANGSNFCIDNTTVAADAFLTLISYNGPTGTYTLTTSQRTSAISLKNKLDTYNNGGGCI